MLSKAYNKARDTMWQQRRKMINKENQMRLKAKDTTILSSNCNGGVLSHDLGLQFCSPTVNMYFNAEDFIKFCENLEHYLSIDKFVECIDPAIVQGCAYPVAWLDDLLLYLVHYTTTAEAQEKWNERKKRINWNNIVILDTDRDGMTEELKDRFEKLPYRKVMFVHEPDERHASAFYIKGYEDDGCVGVVTDHDTWDGKRPIDQFDYVGFLNGSKL